MTWLVLGLAWLVVATVAGSALGKHLRRIGKAYSEPGPPLPPDRQPEDREWREAA